MRAGRVEGDVKAKFELGKKLGAGAFGTVVLAKEKASGRPASELRTGVLPTDELPDDATSCTA